MHTTRTSTGPYGGEDRIVSFEAAIEARETNDYRGGAVATPVRVRDLEAALSGARAEETESKTLNAMLGLMPPAPTAADQAARAVTVAASANRVSAAQEARRRAERALRAARVTPDWDRERLWEANWS